MALMQKRPRVLTIAGAAAGGSAGIQADLKTFQELKTYGMSVITAIVAFHEETKKNIHPQSIEAIEAQFQTLMRQVGVDTMKVGMLFSEEVITRTYELVKEAGIRTIVVDPVMVGKLDSKLLRDDAIEALKKKWLPIAKIITPNMPEASILLNERPINTVADLKQAAIDLYEFGPEYVLVKGGRLDGPAVDVLYDGKDLITLEAPRIDTVHTSGAGCTYSAAITSLLAHGHNMEEAVIHAKSFVTTAIEYGFSYTDMVGPTDHAAERTYGEAHQIKVEKVEL